MPPAIQRQEHNVGGFAAEASLKRNEAMSVVTTAPSTGPTLDARQFSTVAHAGTVSDPWPGTAIQSALMALPATGGTVMVADGVWRIDSQLQLTKSNWSL